MGKSVPKHIGIIPDGNRRWAVSHGFEKKDGYEYGLEPAIVLLKMASELGVQELTYYGFTKDNCKRPKEQFQAFQKACIEAAELLKGEGVDLLVLGDTQSKCFPQELVPYTVRTPINGGGIRINILVNYGWQWDLSQIQKEGQPFSKDISRMDMIIRWGGMRRLSGFLPIQSVYADFYVVEHMWPDYANQDLLDALDWYSRQDVTLGG